MPRCCASSATSTAHGATPTSGGKLEVKNPATGEALGTVPQLGAAETARAIDAARAAFPGLGRTHREGSRGAAAPLA